MRSKTTFRLAAVFAAGLAFTAAGCSQSTPPAAEQHAEGETHAHEHAEHGPHDGQLIELGAEEYHAELTHDEATDEVTIYLLDGAAKQAVASADPQVTINYVVEGNPEQYTLAAKPQQTDKAGESSRFSLIDKKLHAAIENAGAKGQLNVTIAGKPYTGDIAHHDEHDGHKH